MSGLPPCCRWEDAVTFKPSRKKPSDKKCSALVLRGNQSLKTPPHPTRTDGLAATSPGDQQAAAPSSTERAESRLKEDVPVTQWSTPSGPALSMADLSRARGPCWLAVPRGGRLAASRTSAPPQLGCDTPSAMRRAHCQLALAPEETLPNKVTV